MSLAVHASLALLLAPGCGAPGEPVRIERRLVAMGTELAVEVEAEDRPRALAASEAAVRAIEDAEQRLSTWREGSELARLNATRVGEVCTVGRATREELAAALALAEQTRGAFDPTVGALVSAYDLRGAGRWPSDDERARARAATGWRELAKVDRGFAKRVDGLIVEEGGFGKGAGLDAAARALAEHAARAARLDLGGQVLWLGDAERALEIAGPRDRSRAAVVVDAPDAARSAATTGNGELGRDVDGRFLGHVLDPRTGAPARDFGSVTVFAPSALEADALSTGLHVLGPDGALAFAATSERVDVLVLESARDHLVVRHSARLDGRVRAGSGFVLEATADPRRHVLREIAAPAATPLGALSGARSRHPIR